MPGLPTGGGGRRAALGAVELQDEPQVRGRRLAVHEGLSLRARLEHRRVAGEAPEGHGDMLQVQQQALIEMAESEKSCTAPPA